MLRSRINLLLDIVSFLVFLALLETGLLIKYVLPPGSAGGRGLSLWGWSRHDWGRVHWWLAVGLVGLMLAHVALHWQWVCTTLARLLRGRPAPVGSSRTRNVYGVVFLAVMVLLTAGGLWWAGTQVQRPPSGGAAGEGHGWRGGRGRTAIDPGPSLPAETHEDHPKGGAQPDDPAEPAIESSSRSDLPRGQGRGWRGGCGPNRPPSQ